jgi:hypothetical protein
MPSLEPLTWQQYHSLVAQGFVNEEGMTQEMVELDNNESIEA